MYHTFFIHSSIYEHLSRTFRLLWITLQLTCGCRYLFSSVSFSSNTYPEVRFLHHIVILFWVFLRQLPCCFLQCIYQFLVLTTVLMSSLFSTSSAYLLSLFFLLLEYSWFTMLWIFCCRTNWIIYIYIHTFTFWLTYIY